MGKAGACPTGSLLIPLSVEILLTLGMTAGCAQRSARTETGANTESLESSDRAILIVVNADDVGVHPNFTDASLAALESGVVSSASVLAPGHDADRALALLAEHPEYEVGVHLTLTGDWAPLTPKDSAPGLYNENGTMWDTAAQAAAHVKPEEARIEWDAQIRKVLDAGIRISHLDSHMGCYFENRGLYLAALELAKKYKVPLISPSIPPYSGRSAGAHFSVDSYIGIYTLPHGTEETITNRSAAYRELFSGLGPGIHYLYTHHGLPAEPPFGDLPLRIDEFEFWNGGADALLKEYGIGRSGLAPVVKRFLAAF